MATDHFVIIGAQRCGTTYLTRLLDEHPEIDMARPVRPEPKFFCDDAQFEQGLSYYEHRYFPDPCGHVRGEKSTSYIESDVALRRIGQTLPDAVVVVVLRDPIRRAVSNYRFSVENGLEDLPIVDALRRAANGERGWDTNRVSVSPYAYLARGRYVEQLERISGYIPDERVHIVVFEELTADREVLAGLYRRLGVDAAFRPAGAGTAVNASPGEPDALPAETEAWLRDYFREPNRRLAARLGRALPWPG